MKSRKGVHIEMADGDRVFVTRIDMGIIVEHHRLVREGSFDEGDEKQGVSASYRAPVYEVHFLRLTGDEARTIAEAFIGEDMTGAKGWFCPRRVEGCGVFNGEEKERRETCRCCEAPRPPECTHPMAIDARVCACCGERL